MTKRRLLPTPASTDLRDLGFVPRGPVGNASPVAIVRAIVDAVTRWITGREREHHLIFPPLPEYLHPELRCVEPDHAGPRDDGSTTAEGAPPEDEDEDKDDRGFWFDFVADTGDGFDATYTVARLLAEPTLTVGGHKTHRGRLLVLGGDLAYPAPDRGTYRDRLIGPYRAACPIEDDADAPDVIALPGTHDWIDDLIAFRTTFTQGGWLGSWRLSQSRSYVAAALPHRYWLWGLDVNLGVDVEPQRTYFQDAARKLGAGDRVIVCSHHPLWLQREAEDLLQLQRIAGLILDRGAVPVLQLSGKHHYYAHYTAAATTPPTTVATAPSAAGESAPPARASWSATTSHAIICGGGGAFTELPTLAPAAVKVAVPPEALTLDRGVRFPEKSDLSTVIIAAAKALPKLVTPLMFLGALAWGFALHAAGAVDPTVPPPFGARTLTELAIAPSVLVLAGVTWALCLLLARERRPKNDAIGRLMATGHALAYGFAAIALAIVIAGLVDHWAARASLLLVALYASFTAVIVLYLVIAHAAGRHHTELAPAASIQDWKSFLRLRIDTAGNLHIHPIGIRNVPHWRFNADAPAGSPWFELPPGRGHLPDAHLIGDRITIDAGPAQRAATTPIVYDPPYDVFVSYSRANASWVQAFIAALEARAKQDAFGELRIFVDTRSLQLGEHWRARILTEIRRCHAFVAILSPAFVAAYDGRDICFEEYEQAHEHQRRARHRAGDPTLQIVYDVVAVKDYAPPSYFSTRQYERLGAEPKEIAGHENFGKLCTKLLAHIRASRAPAAPPISAA